ncbi:MAG: TetR/AcrR family transcriptional regulator [Desulfomicrobium sp.]|jgi:AcrR family transcriptional regulator|nr:TetR/AcrR family transcriptional regulator [Desulfomicrobium sp.]NLV97862.1 TetR/AcrR family transcriptional regulator [Desulfovibrionales bacterium]
MSRPVIKREIIEETAIKIFATKGLARTTIKDIASQAGVTEGALYRYYDGKEEMAWKLFNRELEKFTRLIFQVLFEERMCFALRLGLAIKTIYDYYRYNGDQFAFILLTQHGFPEEKLQTKTTDPVDMVATFIGQAVGRGEIPPCDADLFASLIMGAALQPLVLHRYGRLKLEADTHNQVTQACLRLLDIA